jgi:hypothetical protein
MTPIFYGLTRRHLMHDNALEIAIFLYNNGQSKGFSRIHVEGDLIDQSIMYFHTYH